MTNDFAIRANHSINVEEGVVEGAPEVEALPMEGFEFLGH